MPTYQDYFDMYSGNLPGRKKEAVDEAAKRQRERLEKVTAPAEAYRAMAGRDKGEGYDSATQEEKDFRNLSPLELENKYGEQNSRDMVLSRVKANNSYRNTSEQERSWGEATADGLLGFGSMMLSGFGNIAAWGVSQADAEAGLAVADSTKVLSDAIRSNQTETIKGKRKAIGGAVDMARRDNAKNFSESEGSLWDKVYREAADLADTAALVGTDGAMMGDITADAAGSLGSGLGLGMALRTVGKKAMARAGTGVAATRAAKVGNAAAMPVSIGLQEGGGSYAGTVQEGMDLLEGRDDLTYDQKLALADAAAQTAAAIQGTVGAVLGKVTGAAKIEKMILKGRPSGDLFSAMMKEMVEEGAQSASGKLASNYALKQEIDQNRDIAEGVGEDTAYGMLGGLGAAGISSGPSAAIKTTGNVAKGLVKGITDPIIERGRKIEAAARDVSFGKVGEAVNSAVNRSGEVIDSIRSEGLKKSASDIADRIKNTNMDDVRSWTETATNTAENIYDRMASAYNLKFGKDASEQVVEGKFRVVDPSETADPEDTAKVNEMGSVLTQIYEQEDVKKAVEEAEILASEMIIDQEDVTPENPSAIKSVIAQADLAPDKSNPDNNNLLLEHARNGKIELSPMERATLLAANALQAQIAKSKRPDSKTVSAAVEQEVSENVRIINRSMNRGNTEEARARLEDMRMVAQMFQNKIEALNEHAARGTGNKSEAVPYENLIGDIGSRKWRPAEEGMWVNTNAPKTVNFARDVERDAQAYTQLVNELAQIHPELGIEALPEVALDFTRKAAKAAEPQAKAEPEAAEAEAPATEAKTEQPASKTADSNIKSTTEAAETAQPKGGDTSTEADKAKGISKVSKERARKMSDETLDKAIARAEKLLRVQGSNKDPNIVATLELLDEEMNRREDQAYNELDNELAGEERRADRRDAKSKQDTPKAKKAEPKQSEATPEPASTKPDNTARPDRAADPATQTVEQQPEPVEQKTDLEEALAEKDAGPFASLIGNEKKGRLKDWFRQAFKIPEQPRTRTFGTGRPVSVIMDALKSATSLRNFIGKSLRHEYSEELAETYTTYIGVEGKAVGARMTANMKGFLGRIYGGVEQSLIDGKMPTSGKGNIVDIPMLINGKALNITEVDANGKVVYNSELLGSAILAGLQWALTIERYQAKTTDKQVEEMFPGVTPEAHDRLKRDLDRGVNSIEVKRTLARQIMRYWGVTPNKDTDLTMVQGIAEAVAAELMTAMVAQDILGTFTATATAEQDGLVMPDGKKFKRSVRIYPKIGKTDALAEWPTAIEEAVMVDPETNHIGQPPAEVANTQMNNRRAFNTKDGKKALSAEDNTPYYFDMSMLEAYIALGKDNIAYLFGGGDLTNRKINNQTRETLKGRNTTMVGAFEQLVRLKAEAENRARAISANTPQKKPMKLSELPIFFAHNFSSIGRMQQLGLHSPQASKLMREVLLPTWSTLNLTDRTSGDFNYYSLALAQALGIKVETQPIDVSGQQVRDMLEDPDGLGAVVDDLRTFLQSGEKTLSNQTIIDIRTALKDDNTPVAFHALMDYARFKEAEAAGTLGSFKTSLYVEADGVTNGPVNAMAMLTPGEFNAQWIRNMAKGGMFMSDIAQTMNDHRSKEGGDSKDLYTSMADRLSDHISQMFADMHANDNSAGNAQLHSLLSTFAALKPKDFKETSSNVWMIARSITKNPLTITLYGSAEKGIAGNIVKDMIDEIYVKLSNASEAMADDPNLSLAEAMFGDVATENMTAEQHLDQFEGRLNDLITKKSGWKRGEIIVTNSGVAGIKLRTANLVTFKFNAAQIEAMRVNTRALFVRQMTAAIRDTVGKKVMDALDNMRKATQVQGIFYEAAFRREMDKALAKKAEGEFLSQNEIDEILSRLEYLAPKIQTGKQLFDISGSDQADIGNREFGKDFGDKFKSPAYVSGPVNPGVSGIPTMVIGMGDGYMMQFLATMTNAIKGTLKVFDGMNMPLDKITEGSRQANQAAFESWMNNPMKHLHDSFSKFLKDAPLENMSKAQLEELGRSLLDYDDQRRGVTPAKIKAAMANLERQMGLQAMSVEARHNVLRRTNMAVDQMASTGVTYQNEGDIDLTGLNPEQQQVALNKAYWEEFNKLRGEQTSEEIAGDLVKFGVKDEASGAIILDEAGLRQAISKMKIPAEHKSLIKAMLISGQLNGYRVAVGVPWRLNQWATENSSNVPELEENTFGVTDPDNKIIYLVGRSPSSETLAHELLHGATFATVYAHYQGQDTTNKVETKRAVERIEALMQQFLEMGDEGAAPLNEVSENSRQSYADARAAIEKWLNRTDVSEAARKAGALNEFMAWSLTNQDLIRMQKRTKATTLGQIVTDAIRGLKTLIWGKRDLAPKVWSDMHSNLRFNTEILLHAQPSVHSMLNDMLFHASASAGPATPRQARLQNIKRILSEKIIQFLDVELEEQGEKDAAFNRAFELAGNAANSVWRGGFQMDPIEKEAFLAVVASLGTQAQIDPNVLAEGQRLYAHVLSVMKPSHFMEDPSSTDPNDLSAAQDKYDTIIGLYDSGARDTENRSTLLPTFLALSMVNEEFAQALARMPMPPKQKLGGKTLDELLNNVGLNTMDRLSTLMARGDRKAQDVNAAVRALTHRMVQQAQQRELSMLSKGLNALGATMTAGNDFVVGMMGRASTAGVNFARRGTNSDNRFIKAGARATEFLSASINETNAQAARMGLMSAANKAAWMPKFMHEVMNEVVGRTDENAGVYDLIKRVRSWVQQTRQMFRDKLPKIIAGKFSKDLDKQTWKDLFNGLGKTDIAALVHLTNMTEAQVMELIADPTLRRTEIRRLETALRQADSAKWPQWQTKADELAEFMVNGTKTNNTVTNALAVANLWGETNPQVGFMGGEPVVRDLDLLISLYALDKQPQNVQDKLAELVNDEKDGVSFALSYLVGQRRGELEKESGQLSDLALANHRKGHVPTENDPGVSMRIAPTSSEPEMKARGYVRVKDYEGSRADPQVGGIRLSYYYSPMAGRAPYSQGLIQNIRPSYSGVDPLTGFTNDGMTGGVITEPQEVREAANRMRRGLNTGPEALLPVYDMQGNIVAFELGIDPEMEAKLQPKQHLAEAIGVWRGRQVEEAQAGIFNARVMDQLKQRWELDRALRRNEYVNVLDPRELRKDPVLRDSVRLLNRETRQMAQRAFGKDQLWVRRDMLNDVLGYRNATIGDLWTGNTRIPKKTRDVMRQALTGVFGAEAYRKLVTAEQFAQNFVTDARVTIVVKSVIVPTANLMANVFQLLSRGVNLREISTGLPKKTAEIDAFVKRRIRRIELEAEYRASTDNPARQRVLKKEIQTILDANRRMSIWPLVEAGEFASIADTGLSQDDIMLTEGRLSDYMEKLTSKLPKSLQTAGRYGIVSKDTALYQGLQKAVEYGDFLGKAILYEHLTTKKGLTKEQALARITEEFVNYDRLAGRSRTYLENMGLMWFWNFKLRSIKIAMSIVRNNPVHALFAMSGPIATDLTAVGSPLYDNGLAVGLDGRSAWSLGPNMAFNAHMLNPWFNLTT